MMYTRIIIRITNNIIAPAATEQKQEREEGAKGNSTEEPGIV